MEPAELVATASGNAVARAESIPNGKLAATGPSEVRVSLFIAFTALLAALYGAFIIEKSSFLYKEVLGLGASQAATIGLLAGIPAYLRAFMGASSDFFPIFGFHRRTYYALAWLLIALATGTLAIIPHYTWLTVVCAATALSAGATLLLVIVDAIMVRIGNQTGSIGTLQSIQQGAPYLLGLTFYGPLSGYVTQNWSYASCFTAAALCGVAGMGLTFLIEESPVAATAANVASEREARRAERVDTLRALRSTLTPGFIVLVAYLFYLVLTPGTLTAQFYYAVDVLHLSKQTIGNLTIAKSAGALIGLAAFGFAARRLPVASLIWLAFGGECITYLLGFALRDLPTAFAYTFVHTAVAYVAYLALLTLAAKACPPRVEGAVYGLIVGAQVLALAISNKVGSAIYDAFGPANHFTIQHGWFALLWIGLGSTLVAPLLVPFLPAWTRSTVPIRSARPAPL